MNRKFKRQLNQICFILGLFFGISFLFYLVLVPWKKAGRDIHSVTVYSYSDMLSQDVFEEFTQKTGIHVNVKHFEAVEELMTKLLFAHEEGIDLVAPTDSMVEVLIQAGLLQRLDTGRLKNFSTIDRRLLNNFYDPGNQYAVPFVWSPIGIGYDKNIIKKKPDDITWGLVFGNIIDHEFVSPPEQLDKPDYTVCMGEDPWETLFLGAIHLYGDIRHVTPVKQRSLVGLLRKQRDWLECYTNNLKYFLISGVSPCVVIPGAYMLEIMEECPDVNFALPEKGSLNIIGELAVPRSSQNKMGAYRVIDYLISKQGGLKIFENHWYTPTNSDAYQEVKSQFIDKPHAVHCFPEGKRFEKLVAAHNEIPLKTVEHMWHKIKL